MSTVAYRLNGFRAHKKIRYMNTVNTVIKESYFKKKYSFNIELRIHRLHSCGLELNESYARLRVSSFFNFR